jgi:hypothetical protein
VVALGTASDMVFNENIQDYLPEVEGLHGASVAVNSDWFVTNANVDEQQLVAVMTEKQKGLLNNNVSVMLSIAVEFGTVGIGGEPVEVKYAGCGKVLKLV